MKNPKKAASFVLAACIAVSLCSCASGDYPKYSLRPDEFLLGETVDASGKIITPDTFDDISAPADSSAQLTADDIQKMNGGNARMVFSKEGYLTFLNGKYYDGKITNQEDAIASIKPMALLLGMGAGSEFFCEYGETDPKGYTYYTFKQRYGGGTVQYATLRVVIDPDGYSAGLACSFTPNLGIAPEVSWITPEEAEKIVTDTFRLAGHNLTVYSEYTKKIAVRLDETLFSAYAVYTPNFVESAQQAGLAYIEHYVSNDGVLLTSHSASVPTGTIADERAYSYFENKKSYTYNGTVRLCDGSTKEISVPVAYSEADNTYYLMDINRRIAVCDYAEFVFNGYPKFASSPTGNTWDNNHLIAYSNYIDVYDFYASLGIKSVDATGTPIIVCCDYVDQNGRPVNNACNMGIINGLAVFAASDANYYSEAIDVITHEFTHGVTGYSMGGCRYLNETGAINEAYSDIMGNIVEMLMGRTYDTQWQVGEMANDPMRVMSDPHKSNPPQPVSLSDPNYYAPVPDEYLEDDSYILNHDNGGVHYNNSLLSQMAYKLWENGMSLDDQKWLWITSVELITPLSGYQEVYEALVMSIKINGFDEKYVTLLTDEFRKAELIS